MNIRKITGSIKTRIIGLFVGLGVIIGVFVLVYFPTQQSKQAFQSRFDEINRLAVVLGHSVLTGVQFEDTDMINTAVEGAANREDLVLLEVTKKDGTSMVEQKGASYIQGKLWKDNENILRVQHPVEQDGEVFGYLKMSFSLEDIQHMVQQYQRATLVVCFIIIGLGIGFGLYLSRLVLHPIKTVHNMLAVISRGEGDLTKRIDLEQDDEVGAFADEFDIFIGTIHDIVKQVKGNTEYVAAGANEIKTTTSIIAAGAEEQRTQTNEVAASVQEMTATILENSRNASKTAEVSVTAKNKTAEGSQAMLEVKKGIDDIVVSAQRTDKIVGSLSERVGEIGEIIEVINDIADQTNLLALNAAIEAARAGEQGRGFAVVADEVRKLAERTTKATAQIEDTIAAIQTDTKEASQSTVESLEAVNKGKESTLKTENVLNDIMDSVTQAMDMINQIATATEEMSAGAKEIATSVDKINGVTIESTQGIEQMASVAAQLSGNTQELQRLVGKFVVREQ